MQWGGTRMNVQTDEMVEQCGTMVDNAVYQQNIFGWMWAECNRNLNKTYEKSTFERIYMTEVNK